MPGSNSTLSRSRASAGVTATGISLTVNGTDRTAELAITGDDESESGVQWVGRGSCICSTWW